MAYIYTTMGNRMLVIFMVILSPFFYLTVPFDKLYFGHYLELS